MSSQLTGGVTTTTTSERERDDTSGSTIQGDFQTLHMWY